MVALVHQKKNGKEIYKFKASNKNNNFSSWFCLGSASDECNSDDLNEVSFKGNICDFSVDFDSIDKSNILNMHKYLIIKNRIQKIGFIYCIILSLN